MPNGFTITARSYSDGKHEIFVFPGKLASDQAERTRRRATYTGSIRKVVDWQVAEADTLDEVRSVLMTAFGMRWFNRARKQLSRLSASSIA